VTQSACRPPHRDQLSTPSTTVAATLAPSTTSVGEPLTRSRSAPWSPLEIAAADPLNYTGIVLPGERLRPGLDGRVAVG